MTIIGRNILTFISKGILASSGCIRKVNVSLHHIGAAQVSSVLVLT